MSTSPLQLWSGGGCELAERTRWLGDRLSLTDILASELREAPGSRPGDSWVLARLGMPLGAAAPIAGLPGEWIAAAGTEITMLGPDGALTWLGRPEDGSSVPTRMNDGCCDPSCRFWAGSMTYDDAEEPGRCTGPAADGIPTGVGAAGGRRGRRRRSRRLAWPEVGAP